MAGDDVTAQRPNAINNHGIKDGFRLYAAQLRSSAQNAGRKYEAKQSKNGFCSYTQLFTGSFQTQEHRLADKVMHLMFACRGQYDTTFVTI